MTKQLLLTKDKYKSDTVLRIFEINYLHVTLHFLFTLVIKAHGC